MIANAKHFVNNNQETNRNTVLEIVDERTRFEIYYPPFEGVSNFRHSPFFFLFFVAGSRQQHAQEAPPTSRHGSDERL